MKRYIVIVIAVIVALVLMGLVFDWGRRDVVIPDTKEDLIVVSKPTPLSVIKSPVSVSGKAKGFWFFEASFPVSVEDEDGNVLGQGIAQADGEWMTEEYVNFTGKIDFTVATGTTYGKMVFKKDNPSGLPENDDSIEIPIRF